MHRRRREREGASEPRRPSLPKRFLFSWVAQSVERATPGEEVLGSIPAVAARSLLVGSVTVKCDWLRHKSWSPHSVSCVVARKIVRRQSSNPSAI